MNKIIIIGNSGSGKTWLGKKLASVLGISHISLDNIFWEPGGYNRKRNESDVEADIQKIQNSGTWITEGVFGHIVEPFIDFADTLIYINLSWDECRKNLLNRGSESSRQLDPKKAEENFQSLLEWASEYEAHDSKASKRYHSFLFESFSGQKHMVTNRDEIDQIIGIISANKSATGDSVKTTLPLSSTLCIVQLRLIKFKVRKTESSNSIKLFSLYNNPIRGLYVENK